MEIKIEDFNETIQETDGFLKKLNNKVFKKSAMAVTGLCVLAAIASGNVQANSFSDYVKHENAKIEQMKSKIKNGMENSQTKSEEVVFNEVETQSSLKEKLEALKFKMKSTEVPEYGKFQKRINVVDNDQDKFNMVSYMSDEQILEEMKLLDPLKAQTILSLGYKIGDDNNLAVNSPVDAIKIANDDVIHSKAKYIGSSVKPTLSQIGDVLIQKELLNIKFENPDIDKDDAVALFKKGVENSYDDLPNYLRVPTNQSKSTLKYK